MKYLILIPIFLTSCGVDVRVHTDPITINHNIDITSLKEYYNEVCIKELGKHATNEQLNSCIEQKLQDFFDNINS